MDPAAPPDRAAKPESWCQGGLVVTVDGPEGRTSTTFDRPFVRIGSHGAAEVRIADGHVPPRALYLHRTEEGIFYVRLTGSEESRGSGRGWLSPEQVLRLGPHELTARCTPPLPDPDRRPANPEAEGSAPGPCPTIAVAVGGEPVAERQLNRRLTIVGRQHRSTLRLVSPHVSSCHLALYWAPPRLWVIDLLSSNGTWYEGNAIDAIELPPDATVTVGNVELTHRAPAEGYAVQAEPEDAPGRTEDVPAATEGVPAAMEGLPAAMEEPSAAMEEPSAAMEEPSAAMEGLPDAMEEPSAAADRPELAQEGKPSETWVSEQELPDSEFGRRELAERAAQLDEQAADLDERAAKLAAERAALEAERSDWERRRREQEDRRAAEREELEAQRRDLESAREQLERESAELAAQRKAAEPEPKPLAAPPAALGMAAERPAQPPRERPAEQTSQWERRAAELDQQRHALTRDREFDEMREQLIDRLASLRGRRPTALKALVLIAILAAIVVASGWLVRGILRKSEDIKKRSGGSPSAAYQNEKGTVSF